jgi:hypothetical protein
MGQLSSSIVLQLLFWTDYVCVGEYFGRPPPSTPHPSYSSSSAWYPTSQTNLPSVLHRQDFLRHLPTPLFTTPVSAALHRLLLRSLRDSFIYYSSVAYSSIANSSVAYSSIAYSSIAYSFIAYSFIAYSSMAYSSIAYSSIAYSFIAHSSIAYSSMAYSSIAYSSNGLLLHGLLLHLIPPVRSAPYCIKKLPSLLKLQST